LISLREGKQRRQGFKSKSRENLVEGGLGRLLAQTSRRGKPSGHWEVENREKEPASGEELKRSPGGSRGDQVGNSGEGGGRRYLTRKKKM